MSAMYSPRPAAARRLLAVSFVILLLPTAGHLSWRSHFPEAAPATTVNDIRGCLNGTASLPQIQARVGFLIPTFTLTPYVNFNHSFYAFYMKYHWAQGYITKDLEWLKTHVTAKWSPRELNDEKPLSDFLTSRTASDCGLVLGTDLRMTDDIAVDNGALFAGGARQFDVLILGHEEYVTRNEYDQLRQFVASGGRVVEMSGNTFWGEVNYSRTTQIETFVAGHGFQFDGSRAWATPFEPFDSESAGWFGSTFAVGVWGLRGAGLQTSGEFGAAVAQGIHGSLAFTDYAYPHDEVNYLRNMTGTDVVAKFYTSAYAKGGSEHFVLPFLPVDSYIHRYRLGEVVCLCVFGENIIKTDLGAQFFLVYAVREGFASR
ncbi:MAG: hypothetical protein KGI38_11070 [Thaumarchaeota archaeon]|nr:hypothetical protein [Nitrososphaerota archaeon]